MLTINYEKCGQQALLAARPAGVAPVDDRQLYQGTPATSSQRGRAPADRDWASEEGQAMKDVSEIDRTVLRAILKFRKDGGSHQDALALTRLLFRLKTRLVKAARAS